MAADPQRYWRISSTSRENLRTGLQAGTWGAASDYGLTRCSAGDGLAFYVSTGPDRGYWATGRVLRPLFESSKPLWHDALYPFRINFELEFEADKRPLEPAALLRSLGQKRLTHYQPRGVIQLTEREFHMIGQLLQASAARAT